jgi:hypothetical protein
MNTIRILDSLPNWAFILIILGVFGVIVVAVILIKKYSPHFKNDDKPKSEEEIAQEEVDRLVVPMDEENVQEKTKDEPKKEKLNATKAKAPKVSQEEKIPTSEEAASYEANRATTKDADNADFEAQMKQYALDHPEEEAAAKKAKTDHSDK